ncbi:M20/M25/M40 family metallo-hydrolase [Marinoscillum sp. MHG1-6]|uniref:M20/M25/M40 family metallo-hydrolase n=1 Tax=Marinoscillum sp. MHG1-6 TaxID=2959627 RepID=UPI002157B11F|nr:M20/M25/M40 family metallo-hydrolase [Marinoscillum sp. MHG1-6]
MKLLEQLVAVHAPSGSEFRMTNFVLDYVKKQSKKWAVTPKVLAGSELHDNVILVFGKPRTAIFAHLDSIGFTVRYENQLVPIGGPEAENGFVLVGEDSLGPIECKLKVDKEHHLFYDFPRGIDTGTTLTFKPEVNIRRNKITSPYMDNRLGVYSALKVAETLTDGIIVFSTYEEVGGGSVPMLLDYIQSHFPVSQALISDITWATEGVQLGGGVAISLRDRHIPRRSFLDKIIKLADESEVPYQLEVESSGSSDGREVHMSPYPIDWCFIGAPEENVHSPKETVHKDDIDAMIRMYEYLMKRL